MSSTEWPRTEVGAEMRQRAAGRPWPTEVTEKMHVGAERQVADLAREREAVARLVVNALRGAREAYDGREDPKRGTVSWIAGGWRPPG